MTNSQTIFKIRNYVFGDGKLLPLWKNMRIFSEFVHILAVFSERQQSNSIRKKIIRNNQEKKLNFLEITLNYSEISVH